MLRDLAAWWGRQETMWRLATFGRPEVSVTPHEPLTDPELPGVCAVEGLELGHPLHDRRRRKQAPRGGDPAQGRGWR